MKTRRIAVSILAPSTVAIFLVIAGATIDSTTRASASTVAYWRFEEGPADTNVTHGGQADGVFYAGTMDGSGNGNALSVWAEGWAGYAYRTDVPRSAVTRTGATNNFSVQNAGMHPAMFTSPTSPMRGMTPPQFTIEASFKPEVGGWRTLVGRDSYGASWMDGNLAALYFQITPDNAVAIKFCDVSGWWHQAVSASEVITGFPSGNPAAGHWYHMAAVSDGTLLSLYLDSGPGYTLVAQTYLPSSGSPNTALTAGMGSGSDWVAGTWTVGRGLYAGGHADRAYGFIDEVRISDSALSPDQFLFSPGIYVTAQPQSKTAVVGANVMFSVTATGDEPKGYQWQTNSVDIPGATGSSCTASNVQLTDSGTIFTVIVTNLLCSVTSSPAILTVRSPMTFVVTATNDNGAGSLRQAVLDYLPGDNSTITFASWLSGTTILLTNGQIALNNSFTVDASALPGGITINGNHASRIFQIGIGVPVVLNSLTITNGIDSGGGNEGGGGILNYGNLTMNNCTLAGNSAASSWGGGGILGYSYSLTLNQCTLTGNSATYGGGIIGHGTTIALNQCTVTGNSASDGGGICSFGSATINNSIVAGNTAPVSANIEGSVSLTGNNLTNGAPILAALGNYGGPTPTMPPLPGSPAIDGCTSGTSFVADQRGLGFARIVDAYADIGAVESGNAIPSLLVTTATDENDGIGANAVSLRDALAYAPSGSTIVFAPALSGSTILLTNGQLNVANSVNILGPGAGVVTVSGNGATRVFNVTGTNVTISGLTITNGNGAVNGAGIYSSGAAGGTLTLSHCVISGHTTTLAGGGIYNNAGVMLTVSNCTLSGNNANNGGGGIFNYRGVLAVVGSTLSGNSSGVGGGIMCDGSSGGDATVTVNSSTISSNSAFLGGGGIVNWGEYGSAKLTVNACTFGGNSATGSGGGAIFNNGGAGTGRVEIANCILSAGAAGANIYNFFGTFISHGYNLSSDDGSGLLTATGDQINSSPLLGPLQNNGGSTWTHVLLLGSPAIDGGNGNAISNLASSVDQRGYPRATEFPGSANAAGGDGSDIGACELQAVLVASTGDAGANTLRAAVSFANTNLGGAGIEFIPALAGQTITLTGGQMLISNNAVIDASGLAGGIILSGNNQSRIFQILPSAKVSLNSLSLMSGSISNDSGGAIFNSGQLTAMNCRFTNNAARGGDAEDNTLGNDGGGGGGGAGMGGAIFSDGPVLALTNCIFSNNRVNGGDGGFRMTNSGLEEQGGMGGGPNGGSPGGGGGYGGGGGGGQGTWTLGHPGAAGGFGGGGGGGGARCGGGDGGIGGLGGTYGGAGGGAYFSCPGGGGGGAGLGGALFARTGAVAIVNCTFNGNTATNGLGGYGAYGAGNGGPGLGAGGALFSTGNNVNLTGSTFSGNSASTFASDVYWPLLVTTLADNGPRSLRDIIGSCSTGDRVTFAPELSGGTILLTSGQIAINNGITVDASALPGGIAINGNHASRVFQIGIGVTAVLNSLTITNGIDVGAGNEGGGGILNYGNLTLNNCTLAGNSAASSWGGGGILGYNYSLTLNQCTLAGNSAAYYGGGIISHGTTVMLNQCTVSGNAAGQAGGGIFNGGSSTINNSIVAGNTAPTSANIYGSVSQVGNNLVSGAPLLAPLGNYGGPTPTMPPLCNSPALDAGSDAITNSFPTDQRGFARQSGAHVDIGAVEAQIALGNPPQLCEATRLGGGSFQFAFTNNTPGATFTVFTTTNITLPFSNWTMLGVPFQSPPGRFQFCDEQATNCPQRFYRVTSP